MTIKALYWASLVLAAAGAGATSWALRAWLPSLPTFLRVAASAIAAYFILCLPEGVSVSVTKAACEGMEPYRVFRTAPIAELRTRMREEQHPFYKRQVMETHDTDGLVVEAYWLRPSGIGLFGWLLESQYRDFHPFLVRSSCPYQSSIHSQQVLKLLKNNDK